MVSKKSIDHELQNSITIGSAIFSVSVFRLKLLVIKDITSKPTNSGLFQFNLLTVSQFIFHYHIKNEKITPFHKGSNFSIEPIPAGLAFIHLSLYSSIANRQTRVQPMYKVEWKLETYHMLFSEICCSLLCYSAY